MELFNNHKIYINHNGSYALPRKDEIQNAVKERISDIKSNKTVVIRVVK